MSAVGEFETVRNKSIAAVDWLGVLMVRVNVKKDARTRDAQQADIDFLKWFTTIEDQMSL